MILVIGSELSCMSKFLALFSCFGFEMELSCSGGEHEHQMEGQANE